MSPELKDVLAAAFIGFCFVVFLYPAMALILLPSP